MDEVDFLTELNSASDFYTSVYVTVTNDGESKSVICPRYGVDCSGYVCFALGITRISSGQMVQNLKNGTGEIVEVGSYDATSPTQSELYAAYRRLAPGNALAHNGHAILVLSNSTSSEQIVVYETKNRLPLVSIYTYSTLWNGGVNSYLPFCQE